MRKHSLLVGSTPSGVIPMVALFEGKAIFLCRYTGFELLELGAMHFSA